MKAGGRLRVWAAVVAILVLIMILSLYFSKPSTVSIPLPLEEQTQGSIMNSENSSKPVVPVSRLPITQPVQRPYLFFETMAEQLSQNIIKYFQLSYFGALWNLSVIEPSIYRSSEYFTSLLQFSKPDLLPFFDLYDITGVEEKLTKCFKPNLPKEKQREFKFHKMDDAVIYSPREILIVRFVNKKSSGKKGCGECVYSSLKKTVLKALNTRVHKFEKRVKMLHGEDYTFRVWKTLCVNAPMGSPFSISKASNCIQRVLDKKRKNGNPGVSVVINTWHKIMKTHSCCNWQCPNFTFNESYCQYYDIPHNPLVLSTALEMQQKYDLPERYIGIYARTERIAAEERKHSGALKRCFQQLLTELNTSQVLYDIPLSNVVLVHDAGKYGSNTMGRAASNSKRLLELFKSHNIRTVSYDPKVRRDLPQDRAFVAAVEQEFLSQSYALLTIGGGGFMRNVKYHFLARHDKDKLHVICEVSKK